MGRQESSGALVPALPAASPAPILAPATAEALAHDTGLDTLIQKWLGLHQSPPPLLFHYTTAQGLTGMLGSGVLWATNVAFMNDPSEVRYAARLIQEVFADVVKARPQPPSGSEIVSFFKRLLNVDDLREWLGRTLEREAEGQVYVTCFCEQGDLLSQWRGYGAAGGGYAVGFATDVLGHATQGPGGTALRRVIYDAARQRKVLRESLDAMIALDELWDRGQRDVAAKQNLLAVLFGGGLAETAKAVNAWRDGRQAFVRKFLAECLVCFKDPAYQEEREWRLIRFGTAGTAARFRTSGGRIIPYEELPFAMPEGAPAPRLPARRIVYGPTLEPGVTDRALSMLCRTHGYTNPAVEISRSTVPFRG